MTPVSCPWHIQNRVDLFLLCRMRMTKPCYIQFLAKIVDLTVQINEYQLICGYTDFRRLKSLFKRKEAMCR